MIRAYVMKRCDIYGNDTFEFACNDRIPEFYSLGNNENEMKINQL